VFGYYFNLAMRSLQRNMVFTALMIIAIGVGIGASMTMLTIFRAASGDPIPQKSAQLFAPQIDNFGPQWNAAVHYRGLLPPDLTYFDATGLTRAHAAVRQAAMYPTSLSITPPDPTRNPIQVDARATDSDFFPMFDVPFRYGGPWSRAEDVSHASVVVLTRALNELLFGGDNSVDKTLRIGATAYRIIGVLDEWHPSPRFYDLGGHGQTFSGDDLLFLPFTRAIDEQMPTDSNLNCDRAREKDWNGLLNSNCIWLRYWVELPTIRDAANYNTFLRNYAFALLLVCVLNAVGLMLANFMARSGVICVRRALGATRRAIFAQFMIEAGVIGVAGGLVGIGLTMLGLMSCRAVLQGDLAVLARLHGDDVLIALAVALAATLLAGLYPTWRAMQVQPALQLKTL
jgi:putative ABC transport system permease protein